LTERFVDFRIVKQRVSIEQVLGHYGIRLRRSNQKSLRGLCPLPTHSSEKSRESFGVAVDKNVWACQSASCASARQGKKGGNVLDFVAIMESCSVRDAALKLDDLFLSSSAPPAPIEYQETKKLVAEKSEGDGETTENKPLTFSLHGIDATHPYLENRGIAQDTAKHFGVGFFPGRGSMNGRVVIPISNERGELVAYAGRTIDGSEPKYKLPAGFKKSEVLFNLHRVREDESTRSIIIVEGFFDTMKIVQAGFRNVVAIMGTALSDAQERLLDPFREIVLMLDGDQAGETAGAALVTRLARSHFVRLVALTGQPDQMSSEEIQAILSKI
jgi:DNA primase